MSRDPRTPPPQLRAWPRATPPGAPSSAQARRHERIGQQRGQRPAPLALRAHCDHLEVQPELGEQLPARSAGRRRRLRVGGDDDPLERARPRGDRRAEGHPLSADRETVGRALDVAAAEYPAVHRLQRRTDPELAVGTIGALLHRARRADQLGAHAHTSFRKEVPAASRATPKYSATVAPISANVGRSPRRWARTRGPSARIGTASREWSVDGVDRAPAVPARGSAPLPASGRWTAWWDRCRGPP